MLQVQQRPCSSCIYRSESPLDLAALEAAIADPHMPGYFVGFRECHHAPPGSNICCAGFYARHHDAFTAGQLAQRLGCVTFVEVDCWAARPEKGAQTDGR